MLKDEHFQMQYQGTVSILNFACISWMFLKKSYSNVFATHMTLAISIQYEIH